VVGCGPIALGLAHRLVDLLVLPHACLEVGERRLGVGAAVVVVVHLHPELLLERTLITTPHLTTVAHLHPEVVGEDRLIDTKRELLPGRTASVKSGA